MKRVVVRIAALVALAVLGTFAIAHAQRATPAPAPLADAVAANSAQPVAVNDPFALPTPRPADAPPASNGANGPVTGSNPALPLTPGATDGSPVAATPPSSNDRAASATRSAPFAGYSSNNRPLPESQYYSGSRAAPEPRYSSENRPAAEPRYGAAEPRDGSTTPIARPAAQSSPVPNPYGLRPTDSPYDAAPTFRGRPAPGPLASPISSATSGLSSRMPAADTRPLAAAAQARPAAVIAQVAGTGSSYGSTRTAPGEPAALTVDPAASQLAPSQTSGRAMSATSAGFTSAPGVFTPEATPVAALTAVDSSAQPGGRQLEGPQSPQLTIQKFAPAGMTVGKPAVFRVTVGNRSSFAARGVEIHDQVPRGTQLIDTKPRAARGPAGDIVWELGTVKPGDEVTVEMHLMPVAEGEIGSVATVRFAADATARAIATRPQLAVKVSAPKKVLIGEDAVLSVVVSNPGTGVAEGVVLNERIPAGMQHAAGAELEYEIGTLKPGESRQLQLPLTAMRAGSVSNVLVAKAEANLRAEERTTLEVVAPQLDVTMEGPKRRFLERQATYTVSVSNPGTAPAKAVELVAYLPAGLKFVNANNAGRYEPATQTVHWTLDELPANDSGKVELTTMPVEAGQQTLRLSGKADKGLAVNREQPVTVEGIAAVLFEVTSVNNPVEVGGQTTYEIRVVNQGSKEATNVRISAQLPAGLKFLAAEGPTQFSTDGSRVQFESLARLAPKSDTSYRVRVQGIHPGDLRVRVQLLTDEMQEPVTKEESTRVYRDE